MRKRLADIFENHRALILSLCILLICGAGLSSLMRESDQASICTGALDLAWGGDIVGNNSYRYEKFFGTYWLLGLVYKCFSIEVGADSSFVVFLGNASAYTCFFISIVIFSWKLKLTKWTLALYFIILSSPVVLLSVALASPNIFALSFLILLLYFWRKSDMFFSLFGIAVSTFCAVACRQDTLLVLPLISFLGTEKSYFTLWKDKKVLIAFFSAVFALLLSLYLAPETAKFIGESFFFKSKITLAYLLFGLSGAIIVYVLFSVKILTNGGARSIPLLLSFSLPLVFYLGLLFTPRHLMLVPFCLLVSISFPKGLALWREILVKPWGRGVVFITLVFSSLSMILGVHLPSLSSPALRLTNVTTYPTADGYWPMGGYLHFLTRLNSRSPVTFDHNQEVWESWARYDFSDSQIVCWDNLWRYPQLSAKIQGYQVHFVQNATSNMVFSERLLRKGGGESFKKVMTDNFQLLHFMGEGNHRIIKFGCATELFYPERLRILDDGPGNDFIILSVDDPFFERKTTQLEGHSSVLFCREQKFLREEVRPFDLNHVELLEKQKGDKKWWIKIMRLPDYMRVENYE